MEYRLATVATVLADSASVFKVDIWAFFCSKDFHVDLKRSLPSEDGVGSFIHIKNI